MSEKTMQTLKRIEGDVLKARKQSLENAAEIKDKPTRAHYEAGIEKTILDIAKHHNFGEKLSKGSSRYSIEPVKTYNHANAEKVVEYINRGIRTANALAQSADNTNQAVNKPKAENANQENSKPKELQNLGDLQKRIHDIAMQQIGKAAKDGGIDPETAKAHFGEKRIVTRDLENKWKERELKTNPDTDRHAAQMKHGNYRLEAKEIIADRDRAIEKVQAATMEVLRNKQALKDGSIERLRDLADKEAKDLTNKPEQRQLERKIAQERVHSASASR